VEEAGAGPSAWRTPGKEDLYIKSISLLVVLAKVLPILLSAMSRILAVYPGSRNRLFSIPDPGSELSPPRTPILIKEFKYFNPQKSKTKWFLSSKKYDPGCSSRIQDPDADLLPSRIPDPGSRGQKVTQSRIPDPGSGSATLFISFDAMRGHLSPLFASLEKG
jgi:hypothetical protein